MGRAARSLPSPAMRLARRAVSRRTVSIRSKADELSDVLADAIDEAKEACARTQRRPTAPLLGTTLRRSPPRSATRRPRRRPTLSRTSATTTQRLTSAGSTRTERTPPERTGYFFALLDSLSPGGTGN